MSSGTFQPHTPSVSLSVRIEKNHLKGHDPCVYLSLDVPAEEAARFEDTDYQHRLRQAPDPQLVTRRSAQEILKEDFNKPEYNQARRYHRHNVDRQADGRGEDDDTAQEYIEQASTIRDGFLIDGDHEDPADAWALRLDVAGALSQLDPRDRALLIDAYLVGLTQRQIATKHGISQPRVKKLLDRAKEQMRDLLE